MNTTKVIKNIQTTIDGCDLGEIIVIWDMEINYVPPIGCHPDNPSMMLEEDREVREIHDAELQLCGKVGVDMIQHIIGNNDVMRVISDMLLDYVSTNSTQELEAYYEVKIIQKCA